MFRLVRVLATIITLRAGPLPASCVHGPLCSTLTRPMVALWSFRDLTRALFSLTTTLIGKVRDNSNSVLQCFALAFASTARAGGVNKAYHGAKLGKNDSWPRVYAIFFGFESPALLYFSLACSARARARVCVFVCGAQ